MPSMMKLVLPALAAAVVRAADNTCSISATTTIQNSGDVAAITGCPTFTGSIAIATDAGGDIAINGIEYLDGNLVAPGNENLGRLSADNLDTIDGDMNLNGLTRLTNVDFPSLKKVKAIKWNALPNLGSIGFTSQVEEADVLDIQNTALTSLNGINIKKAKNIQIANNQYITEIKMQLGNVTTSLDFSNNNKELVVELTNLIWASNLTFRQCGSVSLPSLETLNGSLGLYDNGFEMFAAPNLTEVGSALSIVGNDNLGNLSFPLITKVSDDLRWADNPKLKAVDGLPMLKQVIGAFDISGNMTEVQTPKLEQVKGAFNIQSSENLTDTCPFYKNLKDKKLIRGEYLCQGALENPSTEGTKPKPKGSDNDNAASSLNAMNGALGLAAMAAVLLL